MGEPIRIRNSTSSRVDNQLKTIEMTARKIEKERVYLGINERCSDSFSCSEIESISDTTKVTNNLHHLSSMVLLVPHCAL